ncbi:chemotaxis protein CheW [Archangium lipolyticum]|uniref:chemotaxis protein CheW n=1 Tax=Archangium lipolyticum TaxID=2970465 RepID=UPI002149E397|nr:chemotaxis protein CheW [Archangium lipolyticum]
MPPYESGRRLCLLMEAGETRFSVEATSIMEVAAPGPDETSLRGVLEVKDLSVLLGGDPEPGPGMVVVFDVSPTLAVRVRSIVEVVDAAQSPHFLLPSGLGDTLAALSRSAVLHKERLYLELTAEALPHGPGTVHPPPEHPVHFFQGSPERSLVFESQGRLFGLPLTLVSQVVARGPSFSALPGKGGAVAGVYPHAQSLWPIYSAPALLGAPATPEGFLVLVDLGGRNLGLCASRVLGFHPRFEPAGEPGEFLAPGLPTPVLFLDLKHMFS